MSTPPPPARTWGMLSHLSALAFFMVPFGHVVGPLVVWLVKKNEMPYVDEQGKESLNFQISYTLYLVGAVILLFVVAAALGLSGGFTIKDPSPEGMRGFFPILGLGPLGVFLFALLFMALGTAWVVLVIVASVRANDGKPFEYPCSIKFLH